MKKIKDEYRIPLFLAVLVHVVVLSFLFVRMKTPQKVVMAPQATMIKAVSVNKARVENEMKRIMQKREREAQAQLAKKRRLKQQMLMYQRKRRAEAAHLKSLKKQAKLAAAQALKQKQRAEKARAQAKIAEQKRLERLHAQQALQKELAEEKNTWAQKKSLTKAEITALDRHKALILARISNNWLVPASANHKLSCQFLIHLAPDGSVLSVKLARSSGDPALDRSAQTAVMKSSPLPVPKERKLFDQFRTLRLTVHPREV